MIAIRIHGVIHKCQVKPIIGADDSCLLVIQANWPPSHLCRNLGGLMRCDLTGQLALGKDSQKTSAHQNIGRRAHIQVIVKSCRLVGSLFFNVVCQGRQLAIFGPLFQSFGLCALYNIWLASKPARSQYGEAGIHLLSSLLELNHFRSHHTILLTDEEPRQGPDTADILKRRVRLGR